MLPRTVPAVARLFNDPLWRGNKHDVVAIVQCDVKTAMRCLTDLWVNNNIYVYSWERRNGGPIPTFALRNNNQRDAPKPTAKDKLPFAQRGVDKIYAQRQERARLKKSLANTPTMGFWGI